MEWNSGILVNFAGLWWHGVVQTIALSACVMALGTCLGGILSVGLMSRCACVRLPVRWLVELIRSLPALVLLATIYFCIPVWTGIAWSAWTTAVIALSLNLAPFAAECLRGGLESIPTTQFESARVLGFKGWRLFYFVIGPQAVRRVLPSLTGEWITSIKLTSLAATIGVPELWNTTGQVVAATAMPVESRLAGAALYVAIIFPLLWLVHWLERVFEVRGLGREGRLLLRES